MNNELIRKYIKSVMDHLRKADKRDVAQELDGLIADMLQKRCGDITPTEHDVKVVLAELGEPWELAAKYSSVQRTLIGSRYYRVYFIVLIIFLIPTLLGVTSVSVNQLLLNSNNIWYIGLHWLGNLIWGFFLMFGVVTFIFAVIERAESRYHKKGRQ